MKELQILDFDGENVRVVFINGDPWWVAKDVTNVLGHSNSRKAVSDFCKGVTKRYPLMTPGGTQEFTIISEADVLRLIVSSHLESATRFEKWIFEDVLPTIRKTGQYKTKRRTFIDKTKETRVEFTDTLKNHGCNKPQHYINITLGMKDCLAIPRSKKKKEYDIMEYARTMAAEAVATCNIIRNNVDGYVGCKDESEKASRDVYIITSNNNADYLRINWV